MIAQKDHQPVLGRLGKLETRLARTEAEIEAAQRLRFDVFYRELGALPDASTRESQRDQDGFDEKCEHLLVIDKSVDDEGIVVGTYRFLDGGKFDQPIFYSSSEFDLTNVVGNGRRCLELGRSCIAKSHRSRRTMELAWHGIWSLVVERKIDVMFGCASFLGTDASEHFEAFALLSRDATLAPVDDALPMGEGIPLSDFCPTNEPAARVMAKLPPLLKGYLRLGAKVSSHVVIDEQFCTSDVLVVLDVAKISQKYIDHYGANAERFAA